MDRYAHLAPLSSEYLDNGQEKDTDGQITVK
jgi:hypothetical protein